MTGKLLAKQIANTGPFCVNTKQNLLFNACFHTVNCLDQHVQQSPDRVALIWEKDEPGTEVKITYRYDTDYFKVCLA